MRLVIYLDNQPGNTGRARFPRDPQKNIPVYKRNLTDQAEPAKEDVIYTVNPQPGQALLFNPRILHESQVSHGGAPDYKGTVTR